MTMLDKAAYGFNAKAGVINYSRCLVPNVDT